VALDSLWIASQVLFLPSSSVEGIQFSKIMQRHFSRRSSILGEIIFNDYLEEPIHEIVSSQPCVLEVETWLVQPHLDRCSHFSFDAFECRGLFLVFLAFTAQFRTSNPHIFWFHFFLVASISFSHTHYPPAIILRTSVMSIRFADPEVQELDTRSFGGGWPLALSGNGGGCPVFAPTICTGISTTNPQCCPSGQTCSGDSITSYCCPSSKSSLGPEVRQDNDKSQLEIAEHMPRPSQHAQIRHGICSLGRIAIISVASKARFVLHGLSATLYEPKAIFQDPFLQFPSPPTNADIDRCFTY
jgi:hypothetical protein